MPLLAKMIRRANAGAPPLAALAAITRGLATSRKFSVEVIGGHCEVASAPCRASGLRRRRHHRARPEPGALGRAWAARRRQRRGAGAGGAGGPFRPRHGRLRRAFGRSRSACQGQGTERHRIRSRASSPPSPSARASSCAVSISSRRGTRCSTSSRSRALTLSAAEFDAACLAMADFTDIKSPHTLGHSRAVGALAGEAARRCGLPQADCADL